MAKNLKTPVTNTNTFCRTEIDRMLKYSQTKVIMPVVTLGLLNVFKDTGNGFSQMPRSRKLMKQP